VARDLIEAIVRFNLATISIRDAQKRAKSGVFFWRPRAVLLAISATDVADAASFRSRWSSSGVQGRLPIIVIFHPRPQLYGRLLRSFSIDPKELIKL
jgi:hypothetical protein